MEPNYEEPPQPPVRPKMTPFNRTVAVIAAILLLVWTVVVVSQVAKLIYPISQSGKVFGGP